MMSSTDCRPVTPSIPSKQKVLLFWGLFVLLSVISGIADITHFQNLPERFIAHADQANMAGVARNIAEGKGAVTDSIWLLADGGIKGNAVPQPESYWSIYVAFIISIFFRLFSADFSTLLIPAVLFKIAIAGLAANITFKLNRNIFAASSVAIFLLLNPMMTEEVDGLSDIYLTFFILLGCHLFSIATITKSWMKFLIFGIIIGIAIGTKPSGGLLIGLLFTYIIFSEKTIKSTTHAAASALGILIGNAPLLYHNQIAFDTWISPAYSLVKKAAAITKLTGNHNLGFSDPESFLTLGNVSTSISESLHQSLSFLYQFLSAFHGGLIIPLWQLPFIFVSIILFLKKVKSIDSLRNFSYENQFIYVSIQMLLAGFALALVVHTEVRYWNFLVPLMMILSATLMTKYSKHFLTFIVLTSLISFVAIQRGYTPKEIPLALIKAKIELPTDAVVLTLDPWQFAFYTRRKAIMLPYTSKPEVLKSISKRYNANYIVIINNVIKNELYRPLLENNLPPYLIPVYRDANLIIVKSNW